MSPLTPPTAAPCPPHPWLRSIGVSFLPGDTWPLYGSVAAGLESAFRRLGHAVQAAPQPGTDLIITSAAFGLPVSWRQAPMLTARRHYRLAHSPTTAALVHLTPAVFRAMLNELQTALARDPIVPADFAYPGLNAEAWRVLVEQGQRGGPMLALTRLIQAQTKCIRIVLLVGDEAPLAAYHLDLAGAYPCTVADSTAPERFYDDLVLRLATAVSTAEVTHHHLEPEPISAAQWAALATPPAMYRAGQELGRRSFFTQMLRITDLVQIPAVSDAIASQYSEGCFATWDPDLGALVATITGSARPVDKGRLSADDLAVITGLAPDGRGARTRHVEGLLNQSPSSESVEMQEMDLALPFVALGPEWNTASRVPVVRSKLHGHRGMAGYDPRYVEYVPLDPPYYHYLVSCATEAQAHGIRGAFGRSQALHNPADPRQVVFTVLPGHGVVIAEKWVPGTVPFQTIWEYMDAGRIAVANHVPQGPLEFVPDAEGYCRVRSAWLWDQGYPLPD